MKANLVVLLFLFAMLPVKTKADAKEVYQPATVVSVVSHEIPSNYIGDPSHAPLRSEVYSYDIGIELNCTLYLVRYRTGLNYLAPVFAPRQTLHVSPQKHVMNVSMPGARDLRLSIENRSPVKDASCAGSN